MIYLGQKPNLRCFVLKRLNAKAFAIENTLRLNWSMGPIRSGTKGLINSHTDYIRCQFVIVEVISQILGANLRRFNLLRLFALED